MHILAKLELSMQIMNYFCTNFDEINFIKAFQQYFLKLLGVNKSNDEPFQQQF